MKRILHVYKSYYPVLGGIETYVRQLAEGAAASGRFAVTVLTTAAGGLSSVEVRNGVEVVRAARIGEVASTPLSIRLVRELASRSADLVHLHVPYPVGELAYLLAGRGRPVVVTYHSDVVRQWYARPFHDILLGRLLDRADELVATSPPYVESSAQLSRRVGRVTVIPLGVDPARFGRVSRAEARRQLGMGDKRLLLFVGRFRSYKGLPFLVHALTDPALAGCDVRLVLVGSGPELPKVAGLSRRLGLQDRVTFAGDVEDASLPLYYAACDLFVLPSVRRSEGFGIALLEAMAAGRPVISTELGTGTSWANRSGETGLVVPPADAGALARAVAALLGDDERRDLMGRAARQRVETHFSEALLVDRMARVYDRILSKSGRISP